MVTSQLPLLLKLALKPRVDLLFHGFSVYLFGQGKKKKREKEREREREREDLDSNPSKSAVIRVQTQTICSDSH